MEIETLQLEILEAKRLIDRNMLIIKQHEDVVELQKELTRLRELLGERGTE